VVVEMWWVVMVGDEDNDDILGGDGGVK